MDKQIVIVGAGVAGVNAATKLVDNGFTPPPQCIPEEYKMNNTIDFVSLAKSTIEDLETRF